MNNNVKIIIGSHGIGKSNWIYNYFFSNAVQKNQLAGKNKIDLSKKFYLVVPEQDTNDKQRLLMKMAEKNDLGAGIINIDVVSFDRIAHNVFDILNLEPKKEDIIEDDVKTMLLSLVLSRLYKEKKIKYYANMVNKLGFAEKLTQVVSEFYAYNITKDDIDKVIAKNNKSNLTDKLSELMLIYDEFKLELNGMHKKDGKEKHFSIKEDKYNLLDLNIGKVDIFNDAVVAFDGFTGFTPVQMSIFKQIARVAKEVYVTIDIRDTDTLYTYDENGKIKNNNENDLKKIDVFYLSKKFIRDIEKALLDIKKELPFENYIDLNKLNENKILQKYVDEENKEKNDLDYLQKKLYDYKNNNSLQFCEPTNIELYVSKNTDEEIKNVAHIILDLIANNKCKYEDIKIVVPNVEEYCDKIIKIFNKYDIPFFIDDETTILNSPYIETLRAALDVISYDFSYDSVMRYINSGIEKKNNVINKLDNVIRKYGIRGYNRYKDGFEKIKNIVLVVDKDDPTKKTVEEIGLDEEILKCKNNKLGPLIEFYEKAHKNNTVRNYVLLLQEFTNAIKLKERFYYFVKDFEKRKETIAPNEFTRELAILVESEGVVEKTLENILVINDLNEDKVSLDDFRCILDIGLVNRGIKSIPYKLDQVIVGNFMRSRFDNPKVQIVMGLNQSKIPAKSSDLSIIDDDMRNKFSECDIELSQTTVETVLNQRFYTYLVLTNPKEKLILSYPRINISNESDEKSDIVNTIQNLFCVKEKSDDGKEITKTSLIEKKVSAEIFNVCTTDDLKDYIAKNINIVKKYLTSFNAANVEIKEKNEKAFSVLNAIVCLKNNLNKDDYDKFLKNVINQEKIENNKNLNETLVKDLLNFGDKKFYESVSSIESYNNCPYKYFINSIMGLKEREEYEIAAKDIGTFYHKIIEILFSDMNVEIKKINKEDIEKTVATAVEKAIKEVSEFNMLDKQDKDYYGANKLEYLKERAKKVMTRVMYVIKQISEESKLEKCESEKEFIYDINVSNEKDKSSGENETITLKGKIDSIEKYTDDANNLYFSIIDYKTGKRKINIADVKAGISIQLLLYMDYCKNKLYGDNGISDELKDDKANKVNVIPCGAFYFLLREPIIKVDKLTNADIENIVGQNTMKELGYVGFMNKDDIAAKMINNTAKKIRKCFENDKGFKISGEINTVDEIDSYINTIHKKIKTTTDEINSGCIKINPYNEKSCKFCNYKNVCLKDQIDISEEKEESEE